MAWTASTTPDTDPKFTVEYDPNGDETLCLAVVRAVAAISNTEPMDMPPISHCIDPDVLERLADDMRSTRDWEIGLNFSGHRVTVNSDGMIGIYRD